MLNGSSPTSIVVKQPILLCGKDDIAQRPCPAVLASFAKRNSVNNVGRRFKGIRKTFRPLSHYAGFENRSFSRKTHQTFSLHTKLEEFKNATITGHFGFVFEENWGREIT